MNNTQLHPTTLPPSDAEVYWNDPAARVLPEKAGLIIDASLAFFDTAKIGDKLYSEATVRAELAKQAGLLDDYATEINRLRNVIQAACTAGTDHMIERWKVLFPDAPVPSLAPDATREAVLHACNEALAAVPEDKPISGEWDRGFRDGLGCAITVVRAALHKPVSRT